MELWGSDYLNISSNWRWFSTAPNATLRTDTSIFQQSIWYGLERKITASHVRHWHSFNIQLIQSFFNNRRARVQLFNVFSSSRCFTQGLLQGSILAPLLFLFCTNNLASSLNDDPVVAVFAEDVSILTIACEKEDAETTAQSVVNSVLIWIQEWKLNLNYGKSEA